MSTGLTWVTAYDYNAAGPLGSTWTISFNDYDEAVKFVLWSAKLTFTLSGGPSEIYYYVYTSGPNQNGYTSSDTSSPVLTPFD